MVNPQSSEELYTVTRSSSCGVEQDQVKVKVVDSVTIVSVTPLKDCYNSGDNLALSDFEIKTNPDGYESLVQFTPTRVTNYAGESDEEQTITFSLNYRGHTSTNEATVNVFNEDLGLSTCYYHVVCNADAHVCEGGNLGNNEAVSVPVEVLLSPSPDLVISSLVAPAQAYLGTGVTLTYTIANQGTGALNNTRVMQKFYYSMSPTSYDTLKLLFTNYDYLNLGVNESVSNTVTVTMPINVVSGNYYIHAFVDANNQVYEHEGEHNNKAVSNMIATSVYQLDLRLTQIEGPDVMQWGETATFILHIQNNSALPTLSSSWQDVLYLSSDDVLHATDQLMQSMTHRSVVEPGASYEVPIRVTIPLGAPSTSYLIGVTDYNLNNPDINISNNVLIKTLTINSIPTPDISISEVEVLDDIVSGQQARIAYKVTNVGDIAIAQASITDR